MHKVISINLNGNAYQLDEDAYEALRAYLDRAEAALKENPDKAEIMADLEQAIAEKCGRLLGPGKSVVLKSEVDQIIVEMGPVEGGEETGRKRDEPRTGDSNAGTSAPKRLYRIKEGAMIAGICTGLAAYFHVDVPLVRVLFVIGAFITSGAAILVYFVMMMVIPEANTSDEHAAAQGLPFNAQEIVDQATKFAKGNQAWRRQWRRKQRQFRREWQREWRSATDDRPRWRADDIPGAIFVGAMVPIFFVINAALFVAFWIAIYSLATTGGILGWTIPPGMPFGVAALVLFVLFIIVSSPISAARHLSYRTYGHYPVFAIWSGLVWLSVVGFLLWIGSQHQAEIRDFVQNVPAMWRDIWGSLQER